MNKIILFLFLISIVFSYSDPPLEDVLEHNENVSFYLFSYSLFSTLEQSPSNPDYLAYGNMELLSISPSVGDRIPSSRESFLFWTSNFSLYETLPEICGIKFNSQTINYTLNFTFRDKSKLLSGSVSSPNELSYYIKIPFSESELNLSQADDELEIKLDWENTLIYKDYNMVCTSLPQGGMSCICKSVGNEYVQLSGEDSLSYYVDGGQVIHFLSKPVLKEQWHQNNHFDSIVVSNRQFYKARTTINKESITSSFILYEFNVSADQFGIQSIVPIKIQINDSNYSEFKTIIQPFPLEKKNDTFSFVYQFNSTYVGFGENSLEITLTDYFGNLFSFNHTILSTMLTYDKNLSESGEIIDPVKEEYRGSTAYSTEELTSVLIPASILSLLIIIAFFKFKLS